MTDIRDYPNPLLKKTVEACNLKWRELSRSSAREFRGHNTKFSLGSKPNQALELGQLS